MFGVSVEKVRKWGEAGKTKKLVSILSGSRVKKDIYVAAIKALGQCKDVDQDSINLVITIMRNPDKDVKLAAMEALGNIGSSLAVEHLRHLINDKDPEIKSKAEEALRKIAG